MNDAKHSGTKFRYTMEYSLYKSEIYNADVEKNSKYVIINGKFNKIINLKQCMYNMYICIIYV